MTDLRTVSPDELPELSEIPADLRAVVFSPTGPLQSLPYQKLLPRLIAANLALPTKAVLDADLAHDADSVALVFNDPTPALNGWYRKLGASGAGSWSQFEELSRNARTAAEAAVAAAADAADRAEAAVESVGSDAAARITEVETQALSGVSALALASYFNGEILTLRAQIAAVRRGAIPAVALAARIRNSGWVLEIDVAEADAGGTFDPSKLSLTVFDKGFDENARPIVRPRVFKVTSAIRRPGLTTRHQDIAMGVATWRLSLSKQVFAKAKRNTNGQVDNSGFDPWLTLGAGWYTVGGRVAPDQDGVTTVNNSTEPYPKIALRNFLPPHRLIGANGKFEASGNSIHPAEGRTLAVARCDITGQTSGVTRTRMVKEMTASTAFAKRTNAVPVFAANFDDMNAFTQGEDIRERWRGYPWIGDEPIDSDDGSYLAAEFCTYTHTVNHTGTFGKVYAVVSPTGNDSTGAASAASEAAAAATPFLTERAALYFALQLNISAYGRNNQSGIEICFSDNHAHALQFLKTIGGAGAPQVIFSSDDMPVGGTWCVYRPVTGAANCRLQRNTSTTSGRAVPRRTVLRDFHGLDLVSVTSGNVGFINGGEVADGSFGAEIWVDNSPFINTDGAASTAIGLQACGWVFMTNCNHPAMATSTLRFGNFRHEFLLTRDTDFVSVRTWPSMYAMGGMAVGNSPNATLVETDPAFANKPRMNNIVLVGCSFTSSSQTVLGLNYGRFTEITALCLLNVLFEGTGFAEGGGHQLASDPGKQSGYYMDYVTLPGSVLRVGYEDVFTDVDDGDPEQQIKKMIVFRRSILHDTNTKIDLFDNPPVPARIHSWNVAHRVGWEWTRILQPSPPAIEVLGQPGPGHWIGEAFPPTVSLAPQALNLRAQFENYQASWRFPQVAGAGGGNYMPSAGSIFLGVIPANEEACSIDLFGNPRNGAIGAIERVA